MKIKNYYTKQSSFFPRGTYIRFSKNSKFHYLKLPAVVYPGGTECWYENGVEIFK
jgi:hypothetical protein